MHSTFRHRLGHAAGIGLIGAGITAATQYFIGMPVGGQPGWLGTLATTTAMPAQYLLVPFDGVLRQLPGTTAGRGLLVEASTPFGPALRVENGELILMALATMVIVGLADYLAQGIATFWSRRRGEPWPMLN